MPKCPKHSKFNIMNGIYFRAADPNKPEDWIPKSESGRDKYYRTASVGDLEELARLTGEAQMIHSNESSSGSAFVSVARCPVCLFETTDPTVGNILESIGYICQFEINPKNENGAPFVFDMEGEGIGATETESLVLLPKDKSLLNYFQGYLTFSYIKSMQ